MKGNRTAIILLPMVLASLLACVWAQTGTITLDSGTIINGLYGVGYVKFLGIPYAQAPVGSLRWVSPQQVTLPSTYDATSFKPACPQANSFDNLPAEVYSEDCLYLNIWTPNDANEGGLPVMVYLHGGGWESGSGSLPLYWGDFIANSSSTIIVTLNYRLGALGFLVSEEIAGNFGFEDQRMALQWVNDNIHSFGGDVTQITLFGQSAGGMSVATHLTSPMSYGLFSKAIVHSGPPVITLRTQEESYYFSNQFANHLGCGNSSALECMRAANESQVIAAQKRVLPNTSLPWTLSNFLVWMPVIDNYNILATSQQVLNDGQAAPNVDVIWGSTRNETAGWIMDFLPNIPLLVSEYKLLLSNFFGENSGKVFDEYPANNAKEVRDSLSLLSCDWVFTCSMRHSSIAMTSLPNGGQIRSYVFLHPPSSDPRATGTVAHCADIQEVCHGAELDYVFHSSSFANATFTAEEDQLSWDCLNIWTSYAHGVITETEWPVYSTAEDNILGIDIGDIATQYDYRSSYCDFWESLGVYGSVSSS